jgi:hypothetical protein
MIHPLHVSHYCGVVAVVGLRGGLGGQFLCMAIEDEAVDMGEHVQLGFRSGFWARGVGEARIVHRTLATCDFAGARCPPAYSNDGHYGLDALAGAPLASHPPEATRR